MRPHQRLQWKGHRHPAVLLCRARKGYDACRAVFGALAPLTPGTRRISRPIPGCMRCGPRRLPPPMWSANFTTIRKQPGGSSSTPMKSARPSPGASASIWGWPMLRPRRKSPRPSQGRRPVPGAGGGLRQPKQRRKNAGKAEKSGFFRIYIQRKIARRLSKTFFETVEKPLHIAFPPGAYYGRTQKIPTISCRRETIWSRILSTPTTFRPGSCWT